MHHRIRFTKASGAGNDFVLVDGRGGGELPTDRSALARALCSRHFGVGADGLLLLMPSDRADFRMEYYNADGSYGGMCGNGGRCIARYALAMGIAASPLTFEALDHLYKAAAEGELIRIRMKDPSDILENPVPAALRKTETAWFVDTGSPHLVIFTPDVERVNLPERGRALRMHPAFAPEGANVNFVQMLSASSIRMRTYERGVEAETLACGTGSVASAVAAWRGGLAAPPVRILTTGGEDLLVDFRGEAGRVTDVTLTGSAHLLFEGVVAYDSEAGRIGLG
jgi:diaminopimelate epimerase